MEEIVKETVEEVVDEVVKKGCFPKLKQLFKNLSCKSKCSNCMIVKQDNHLEIKIDGVDNLKGLNFDIPTLNKDNNIKIDFV